MAIYSELIPRLQLPPEERRDVTAWLERNLGENLALQQLLRNDLELEKLLAKRLSKYQLKPPIVPQE